MREGKRHGKIKIKMGGGKHGVENGLSPVSQRMLSSQQQGVCTHFIISFLMSEVQ